MMRLVDKTHFGAADLRARCIRQAGSRLSVDIDLAAIGMLEQTGDVKEGRFAGSGRRNQGDRLAKPAAKLGPAQNFERIVALPITPLDRIQIERRPGPGRWSCAAAI